MEKKRPQLFMYEEYKKRTPIGKSSHIVKAADQPFRKTGGKLKGKNNASIYMHNM